MTEIIIKGWSVLCREGEWMVFIVKDSAKKWISGKEGLKIESPKLFEHIKNKTGEYPKSAKLEMRLVVE